MRLLHIHSGNLYGGVETLLLSLQRCRALCPSILAEFAFCFDAGIAAELRQAGAAVHIVGPVRARNPVQVLRVRRRLLRVLKAGAFDAVICHMAWPLAIFGPTVRRAKLPLIFWMHDAVTRRTWLTLWAGFSRPDLVICNSRYTASTVERLFGDVLVESVYCPVRYPDVKFEPAQRETLRKRLNTPRDSVVIIQASRMESWKGHHLLLQALAQLKDVPNWVCWIAGGAQRREEVGYEKTLHAQAIELGLGERVRFLGQRSDVPQLLRASDIFCQPNVDAEPFGIAFIEAMHAGLPVVTSAIGGALEIFDDSCGLLVRPNDSAVLAAHLNMLLKNAALRSRLGNAAIFRSSQLCDPGQQVRRLETLVRQTIKIGVAPHDD
jgi:glycosyltransferase involved in cell wall biosynthesis